MPGPYSTSDSRSYLGIGKQTVRATGVVPTVFAAYIGDVDLSHNQEINGLREAGGAGQVTLSEKMSHMPTGAFEIRARPSTCGKLFAYLLGADAIAGVGPYTHAETLDFTTDYLSIEQNLIDEFIERLVDCVLTDITFEVSNQDSFMAKLTCHYAGGRPGVQATPTAETYDAESPFLLGQGAYTVDGTLRTNVRRLRLTATVRYATDRIADVVPEYQTKTGFDLDGEIEQLVLNIADEYRFVQYGGVAGTTWSQLPSSGSLIADFNYGAGAAARGLKFDIPILDYGDAKPTPPNPEGDSVKITRPFTARTTPGVAMATITVKSSDAAAYV